MDYFKRMIFEKETRIKILKEDYENAMRENDRHQMNLILHEIEKFESHINYIKVTGNLPHE